MLDCLNGCHDLDYGEAEGTLKGCTCSDSDTLKAVLAFNALGIVVVEV